MPISLPMSTCNGNVVTVFVDAATHVALVGPCHVVQGATTTPCRVEGLV